MTIPEACSLVLKTGGVGKNGISYLLDMGEPIKIVDIAEQIIRISGFEPYKDIDIQFIGLRKGERLDEPLWTKSEDPQPTEYHKILQLKPASSENFNDDKLYGNLKYIQDLLELNRIYPLLDQELAKHL
jgi:FlaA1/EpsC-like NDP-sugar epimerase